LHQPSARQRGAAILTAMLTVTLVATLASAALWQQWRAVEVESAERTRTQMTWVLTGALDWARLILREDARTSAVDHLSEPWALPLAEARLSSFLAVDQNNTDGAMEAFLSGQVTDQQGLLNLANLVEGGEVSGADYAAFDRLFKQLGIPKSQLARLADQLLLANRPGPPVADAPGVLGPQRLEHLLWLGLPSSSLQALRPYVTWLPTRTPVNLNTAPAQVLSAALPGVDLRLAQQMVTQRALTHYANVAQALEAAKLRVDQVDVARLAVASRYFMVHGQLRLGNTVVQEASLVSRDGTTVTVLWRAREALSSPAGAVAASLQ
jgi:general secretion pathway protein K